MLIYFSLIFLNVILGISDRSYNKNISFSLVMIILFFLVGFRSYSVGTDTLHYINEYSLIGNQSISSFTDLLNTNFLGDQRLEPGYIYLVKILNLISPNPQLVIIFESFSLYFSLYLLINKFSLNKIFSVYLLITLGIFITSFNLLRQCIALSFCVLGYYFFAQNKSVKAFISILIAGVLFHRTALVFLILFVFKKMKISFNEKNLIDFIFITSIIVLLYNPIIQIVFKLFPYYKNYQDDIFGNGQLAALFNIIFGICTLFFGLYSKNNGNFNPVFTYRIWNDLSLIIMTSLLFTALSLKFTQISRISEYFKVFYIIYIPNCIYINRNQNKRTLFTIGFFIVALALFSYMIIYKDNWSHIVPYISVFYQNKI